MDIRLNLKVIKEMCGSVSFKRGDAFYRSNKVTFDLYSLNSCKAVVSGIEDFVVLIERKDNENFVATCTCPKLGSFKMHCQHIAAVLLSVYEHQKNKTNPSQLIEEGYELNSNLADEWLNVFDDQPIRTSSHQFHFENRQVLEVEFICKLIALVKGHRMIGIELNINGINVKDIRTFLEHVKEGKLIPLSNSFIYNPNLHCFYRETDTIVHQLIKIVQDEEIYTETRLDSNEEQGRTPILLVPPSSWERLSSFLKKVSSVKVEYDGNVFHNIIFSNERLPLHFKLEKRETTGFSLNIRGLNELIVLNSYKTILSYGKFFKVEQDDCRRLLELKQMVNEAGTNRLPITENQLGFFLEKVVPGLKRLGMVEISKDISNQTVKTPLIAKLYLDRVKNRLLAGLEFHYENLVINPLEENQPINTLLIRDEVKELEVLELMDESLFSTTEGGYFIHNEELEYEFLYNIVPKLSNLVQVYATTAVRNRVFRVNTRPQIRVKVKKERTNWLEFKFEMEGIADHDIRDLLQAVEEKRKYYRLRDGSFLSLQTRDFEEISRFLTALPIQLDDLEEGLNLPFIKGYHLLDSAEEGIFTFEESFRSYLESLTNPSAMNFELPKGLETILRNYQQDGYKWMKSLAHHGFGGILADDMGLGKTLQSIAFIVSELKEIREKKLPALIVCPSSLTYNWLSEFFKFATDIQAVVVDGNKEERVTLQREIAEMDVVITSYPLLRKDVEWYAKQSFHTVFFDEAQMFKNPVTQTAKAVKRLHAKHRFALTGTPVENSLEELWSIFHIVFPELFQGLKEFSHLSRKTITRRIQPFLLRRLKEDVLEELPDRQEALESVELLEDQKKLYAAYLAKLRHDTLKHLDKDTLRKNRIKILAGLTRLRQICCHPGLFVDGYEGSSAKFERLMKILKESNASGRRVLIFSQFTKMLELIGRELAKQGRPFFYLDGQTPSDERVATCNRFNAGERDLFLISLKAGGTGLNVTGADTVILYDIWWNPAVEEQATARAHRIGQTKVVQVIKLITRGTVEEKMNELQDKKRDLIEEIIDNNQKSSRLTDEDIREILRLD
ncbi:DEAD/DEAH box helicase [Litchfieldia salsa]|uniref:Superfamily II DNA or RNA helicase, SNF2 family n=1 Tax=Litchfieldia salsa TaxID=930152 RepID=A0A1H0TJT7_9BACI|nr:DEAD/DEAH box helicase [Litchfieldia salsa]SDP53950.1 Superfamily II DNA or RNA helicase, SNF2 family [Litchfieldia salsa]